MAEYIDREKLRRKLLYTPGDLDRIDCLVIVSAQPLADVRPVVHAHWITVYADKAHSGGPTGNYDGVKCSNCREKNIWPKKICPNCGAIMNGEVNAQQ